jgi:hypothetical protein
MRCWIIGGGKSIEHTPMDLLRNEYTIAMNKIHLAYDWFEWRPSLYVFIEAHGIGDPRLMELGEEAPPVNEWEDYVVNHHLDAGERVLLASKMYERLTRHHNRKNWNVHIEDTTFGCEHHGSDIRTRTPSEWHLPYYCKFGGTLGWTIQWAFTHGFDPIYLVGCDLGYRRLDNLTEDPNHFHPEYWTWDDNDLAFRDDTLIHMHSIAKEEIERRGGSIYNATVGGILEVYDRVDIKEVLNGR